MRTRSGWWATARSENGRWSARSIPRRTYGSPTRRGSPSPRIEPPQGEPAGEDRADVRGGAGLPHPRVQFAAHHRVLAGLQAGPQCGQHARVALQQFPQHGQRREVSVHRPVGAEQLGERGDGPLGADRVEVPGQGLGQDGGGLVGIVALGVRVQVVRGVRVADADHHVVGVGPAERGAGGADGDERAGAGEGLQGEELGDRLDHVPGLAGAGRPDHQQRGAQRVRAEGGTGVVVGLRGALRGHPAAQPHLLLEQVVPGLPGRQVAGAGGVGPGGAGVAQHGVGEAGQAALAAGAVPGPVHAGAVHVVHAPAGDLGGQHVGGLVLAGVPQVGPLGAGQPGGRCGGGVGGGLAAGGQFLEVRQPAAEAGERPHHQQGDQRVEAVGEQRGGEQAVAAGDQRDEGEQGGDDRHRVPAGTEGAGEDEGERAERGDGGQQGAGGLRAAADDVPGDVRPAAEPADGPDQDGEEHAVVDDPGLAALHALRGQGAAPPPVVGGEQLQQHPLVGHGSPPPQRPQQQRHDERDQQSHDGDGGQTLRAVPVALRRPVAEAEDAGRGLGPGRVQPVGDGRPGGGRGRLRRRGRRRGARGVRRAGRHRLPAGRRDGRVRGDGGRLLVRRGGAGYGAGLPGPGVRVRVPRVSGVPCPVVHRRRSPARRIHRQPVNLTLRTRQFAGDAADRCPPGPRPRAKPVVPPPSVHRGQPRAPTTPTWSMPSPLARL